MEKEHRLRHLFIDGVLGIPGWLQTPYAANELRTSDSPASTSRVWDHGPAPPPKFLWCWEWNLGLCWSSHLAGLSVVVLALRYFPLSGVFESAVLTLPPHAKHSLPRPPGSPDVRAGCSVYTWYCWHPDTFFSCLGFCGTGSHYLALHWRTWKCFTLPCLPDLATDPFRENRHPSNTDSSGPGQSSPLLFPSLPSSLLFCLRLNLIQSTKLACWNFGHALS